MRRRIAVTVLAATAMVVIAFVVPLGYLVRQIAEDREVTRASNQARAIGPFLADQGVNATRTVIASSHRVGGRPVAVVLANDRVLGTLEHRDAAALRLARRGEAFVRSVADGIDVYQPVLGVAGGTAVVVVHASDSQLRHGVMGAWLVLGGLGIVLCGVALVVADRIARDRDEPARSGRDCGPATCSRRGQSAGAEFRTAGSAVGGARVESARGSRAQRSERPNGSRSPISRTISGPRSRPFVSTSNCWPRATSARDSSPTSSGSRPQCPG